MAAGIFQRTNGTAAKKSTKANISSRFPDLTDGRLRAGIDAAKPWQGWSASRPVDDSSRSVPDSVELSHFFVTYFPHSPADDRIRAASHAGSGPRDRVVPILREVAAQDERRRRASAGCAIIILALADRSKAEGRIKRAGSDVSRVHLEKQGCHAGRGKAFEMGDEEAPRQTVPAMRGRHGEGQDLGFVQSHAGQDDSDDLVLGANDRAISDRTMSDRRAGMQKLLEVRRSPRGIEACRVNPRTVSASIGADRGDPMLPRLTKLFSEAISSDHASDAQRNARLAAAPSAVRAAWSPPHFSIRARLLGPAASGSVRMSR